MVAEDTNDYAALFDDIKAIVFDLDGTLYQYKADIRHYYDSTAGQTITDFGATKTQAEGTALARQSYDETGSSMIVPAAIVGKPVEELLYAFNRNLLPEHTVEISRRAAQERHLLEALQARTKLAILSHSTEEVIHRTLAYIAMDDLFHPVIGIDNVGFSMKNHEKTPFLHILEQLDLAPHEVLFVEDSPENCFHPKELGMRTALIKYGLYDKEEHRTIGYNRYIDGRFENLFHFLHRADKHIHTPDKTPHPAATVHPPHL